MVEMARMADMAEMMMVMWVDDSIGCESATIHSLDDPDRS